VDAVAEYVQERARTATPSDSLRGHSGTPAQASELGLGRASLQLRFARSMAGRKAWCGYFVAR
jgi:hypothetical protein